MLTKPNIAEQNPAWPGSLQAQIIVSELSVLCAFPAEQGTWEGVLACAGARLSPAALGGFGAVGIKVTPAEV